MSLEFEYSAVSVESTTVDNVVTCEVSGKLTKEDYERLVPMLEAAIERHGKIRMLFVMKDFHGWELSAMWEDLKFDVKHFTDLEKLAMVGDKKWEKGLSLFAKPFTKAQVKYFDAKEIDAARRWLAD